MAFGEYTSDLYSRLRRMRADAGKKPAFVPQRGTTTKTQIDPDRWSRMDSLLREARLGRDRDLLERVSNGHVPEQLGDLTDQEATALSIAATAHAQALRGKTAIIRVDPQGGKHAAGDTAKIRPTAKRPRHAAPEEDPYKGVRIESHSAADTIIGNLGDAAVTLVLRHTAGHRMPDPSDKPTRIVAEFRTAGPMMGVGDEPTLIISFRPEADQV